MLDVRYARSGDADIAYAVVGEGEIPLVWTQGAYTHLEAQWAFPPYRRFCEALGEFTMGGMAGPGEILVSSTVRDISAGSGITFADRGRHELKGVPGDWQVYAVER